MKTTIHKYPVRADSFTIEIPVVAGFLSVQKQGAFGQPQMWWRVDPSAATKRRTFRVFGTGHDMSEEFKYLYMGTFQLQDGALVFHLFEELPL